MEFEFSASEVIQNKISGIQFGLLYGQGFTVLKSDQRFNKSFTELETYLKQKFLSKRPAEDEVVQAVRRMYGRVGWEPTRYRPSSEALIRRILKGKGLYQINNLVDFGNLVSARYHLPMGLYDSARITRNIIIDVGHPGEAYRGISNPEIHAEGKLVLRDDQGIFGNPTADSLRSSINEGTRNILAVFFCPPQVTPEYLQETLNTLKQHYRHFNADELMELKLLRF